MIDRKLELPVSRQAELLDLSRSAVYYQPVPVSQSDLALMRRIDELHLDHPFAVSSAIVLSLFSAASATFDLNFAL